MTKTPICQECKVEIYDNTCVCGLPEEDPKDSFVYQYINHCWNCKVLINSLNCVKSETSGMGYHCNECGHDLTEWKRRKK